MILNFLLNLYSTTELKILAIAGIAGAAISPPEDTSSIFITVFNMVSESEAVTIRLFPSRTNRKFSRIGREFFAAITLETEYRPCKRSVLDTVNFILFILFLFVSDILHGNLFIISIVCD